MTMDKSKWNIGRVLWLLREIISFVIQIKGKKKYGKNENNERGAQ